MPPELYVQLRSGEWVEWNKDLVDSEDIVAVYIRELVYLND